MAHFVKVRLARPSTQDPDTIWINLDTVRQIRGHTNGSVLTLDYVDKFDKSEMMVVERPDEIVASAEGDTEVADLAGPG